MDPHLLYRTLSRLLVDTESANCIQGLNLLQAYYGVKSKVVHILWFSTSAKIGVSKPNNLITIDVSRLLPFLSDVVSVVCPNGF